MPPWRMVQALDHKPEEGCGEAGACSKNSDQESDESALRYKGTGEGYGEEETQGGINGSLKYPTLCHVTSKGGN